MLASLYALNNTPVIPPTPPPFIPPFNNGGISGPLGEWYQDEIDKFNSLIDVDYFAYNEPSKINDVHWELFERYSNVVSLQNFAVRAVELTENNSNMEMVLNYIDEKRKIDMKYRTVKEVSVFITTILLFRYLIL